MLKEIHDPEQRKITCKLIGGQLRVQGKELSPERIQKAVWEWCRERARDVFQRRLDLMVEKLPWVKATPPSRIIEMQTQWGSRTPEGTTLLNPHLVKAPTKAIDYVILHELCHLEEHNHSPRFTGYWIGLCRSGEGLKRGWIFEWKRYWGPIMKRGIPDTRIDFGRVSDSNPVTGKLAFETEKLE